MGSRSPAGNELLIVRAASAAFTGDDSIQIGTRYLMPRFYGQWFNPLPTRTEFGNCPGTECRTITLLGEEHAFRS